MADKSFHTNRLKVNLLERETKIIMVREKKLVESNFNFLKCNIGKSLNCIGEFQPTEYSRKYKFKIKYNGYDSPKVYPIEPRIEFNDDIHMYKDEGNLCLEHPLLLNWDYKKSHIFDTIIPWISEWYVYYELYLITGKWEHPFIPHKKEEK